MATILITGCSRGIGLELTRHYGSEGWRVIATCRAPDRATVLNSLGGDISIHALDVTDGGAVTALAGDLADIPIDVLFSNAGQLGHREAQGFGDLDYAAWRAEIEVNLIAPVRLCETFIDHVAASEQKKIAVVSTVLASLTEAGGGLYPYRTSKAGLNMAVRAMANDLAPRGVSVTAFHPGWVSSDMGGDAAPVTPTEAAVGMATVLAAVKADDGSRFLRYDGSEIPW